MVGLDPVHLPDQVLESRNYIWDVIPWTKWAWSHTPGPTTLTIPENAPELPWPDIDDLLAGVPREHARLLYPRADLSVILIPLHHTKTLLRAFQAPTYYKTQDAQQSTSSTASTSAIFADRSTGN